MAEDATRIIADLRKEAVERCRKRIREASGGLEIRPKRPGYDAGLTAGVKRRYGL